LLIASQPIGIHRKRTVSREHTTWMPTYVLDEALVLQRNETADFVVVGCASGLPMRRGYKRGLADGSAGATRRQACSLVWVSQ
jgi:hypothetical protein